MLAKKSVANRLALSMAVSSAKHSTSVRRLLALSVLLRNQCLPNQPITLPMSKKKLIGVSLLSVTMIVLAIMFVPHMSVHAQSSVIPIQNPIPSAKDVPSLVRNITSGILGIVGAVALLMFIYGGVLFLTSMGNTQKVDKGKNTLLWAALGLIVIFLSYSILTFIFSAISKTP